MRRLIVTSLVVAVALVTASRPSAQSEAVIYTIPAAARAANAPLVGTWKLVGQDLRDPKGQNVALAPQNVGRLGYIVYDPAGFMSVTIQSPGRAKFAGAQPTPREALAAVTTYTSYWGSFVVDAAKQVVTHQTMGSLSTAIAGTNMVRDYTIAGNRLTLRPPVNAEGNQPSLTWERVPDLPSLTPMHHRLVGFWKLVSNVRRNRTGEVLTANPGQTGFIVYTASGHVQVHMSQPYRRRYAGPTPTPDEAAAAFRSYNSYFGPYTVNESQSSVVHHLAGVHSPNLLGTEFPRIVELSGRRLVLKTPLTTNATGEGESTITWERLSD